MSTFACQPAKCNPIYITELLALIFSYLDDRTIAKTAPVCKQWAEVALDVIWRNVTNMRQLLGLLTPLVSEKHPGMHNCCCTTFKFKRQLHAGDWERFSRYGRRIRRISYDDPKRKTVDPSVWEEIARTRPSKDILPNLQSLTWLAPQADRQHWSLMFMNTNIRHLALQLHNSSLTSSYVHGVLARAPHVTDLELRTDSAMRDIQDNVITLVGGLKSLRKFISPMYCLTSAIIHQLSKLNNVEIIVFGKPIEEGTGERADVALFNPPLEAGSFPVLERLCFSAHLPHAAQFIGGPFAPQHLSHLYVHVLAIVPPVVVQQFFCTIAFSCPQLQELHVDFLITPDAPIDYPPHSIHERPTMMTFRPLLSCHRLTKFEFRWDYQINLSQADIEHIASSWPSLEVFLLNCQPIPEQNPLLTLHALVPFAKHCPNIRELGLYLDADIIPPHSPQSPLEPFKKLEILSVGASSVSKPEAVALFLSQLLSLDCEISSGVRWPDAYGIALERAGIWDDRKMKLADWYDTWKEVVRILPLAIKARMEERSRMAILQKEMEALMLSRRTERDRVEELDRELWDLRGRLSGRI